MFVAPDVPTWPARVGGLPDETRPGGHRKPRIARRPIEGWVIDDAATARRRAAGRPRMARRTRTHEADRQGVLCERAAKAVAPVNSQPGPTKIQHRRFPAPARPSAHAAPRLRLRPGRPGRGYAAHLIGKAHVRTPVPL